MSAKQKQGMAALEEFLQQKYVEYYEKFEDNELKINVLEKECPQYFYIPKNEGVGNLNYIVDSDGSALYPIKKSGLPNEIKEGLVGGDAGNGTYLDYYNLNDVYGVTNDLKVYYCSNGKDSIYGQAKENLDKDNPQRAVFTNESPLMGAISSYDLDGDGTITAEEVKSIKELEINKNTDVNDLSSLYNMVSLEKLTIKDKKLNSLNGIEYCNVLSYIWIENPEISDYTSMGKLGSKLNTLYLYNVKQEEMDKMCENIKTAEFSNLQYFGVFGNSFFTRDRVDVGLTHNSAGESGRCQNQIKSIESLSKLSDTTKKAIKYLLLNNESITDTDDVNQTDYLKDFTNVYLLRIEYNSLTTLSGLSEMNNLGYLYCSNNQLGKNKDGSELNPDTDSLASLENKSKLFYLRADNNPDLLQVDYLKNDLALRYLYLGGCNKNMNVNNLATVLTNCGTNYVIPCKFLNGMEYNVSKYYTASTVTYEELHSDLYGNQYIKAVNLDNVTLLNNNQLNEILKSISNLTYLSVRNTNLSKLDFICSDGITKLKELDLINTTVTDLTSLNDYGKNLLTLRISNDNIDLSTIESVLPRLGRGGSYWQSDDGRSALYCTSFKTLKTLEKCFNLTSLNSFMHAYMITGDSTLDLSNCSSLKYFNANGWNIKVKFPSSLKGLTMELGSFEMDINPDSELDNCYFDGRRNTQLNFENSMKSLSKVKKCSFLYLWCLSDTQSISNISDVVLDNIENLALNSRTMTNGLGMGTNDLSWVNKFPNITELDLLNSFLGIDSLKLKSCNGIEQLKNLEILKIKYANFQSNDSLLGLERCNKINYLEITNSNLIDITNLKNLSGSLQKVILSNNSIYSCIPLKNMKKLNYLDLQNNSITDVSWENGTSYNNLRILAELNVNSGTGGNLKELYLAGNTGIADFTPVSSLKWTNWSGFSGK